VDAFELTWQNWTAFKNAQDTMLQRCNDGLSSVKQVYFASVTLPSQVTAMILVCDTFIYVYIKFIYEKLRFIYTYFTIIVLVNLLVYLYAKFVRINSRL